MNDHERKKQEEREARARQQNLERFARKLATVNVGPAARVTEVNNVKLMGGKLTFDFTATWVSEEKALESE